MLTEGCRWRAIDRPEASWNSVYHYYRRWCKNDLWKELLNTLDYEVSGTLRFLDSTHVKVHCDGANPPGGQQGQAMGRTKGGLNTKIHAVVDNKARPVVIALSAGNEADISVAPEMLEDITACCVVADKAYDSNQFRAEIIEKEGKACIPPRETRVQPISFSKQTYKKRHRIENFFQKLKRFRRVATRYDKLAQTYLGFVLLAVLVLELS